MKKKSLEFLKDNDINLCNKYLDARANPKNLNQKEQSELLIAVGKVLEEFLEFKQKYGPVDTLNTRVFFVGPKIAENVAVSKIFFPNNTPEFTKN